MNAKTPKKVARNPGSATPMTVAELSSPVGVADGAAVAVEAESPVGVVVRVSVEVLVEEPDAELYDSN